MARLSLALFLALVSAASAQTWHDTNGQAIGSGSLLRSDASSASIQKTDKSIASLQFDSLSLADVAFIRTQDDKTSEFQHTSHSWSSANGKFHADAKAIHLIDDKTVRLTRSDSKVITVPIDKLSVDDQAYIERLKQITKAADDPFGSVESFSGPPPRRTPPRTSARPSLPKAAPDPKPSGFVDRNPNGETQTGQTATGIPTYTGPRGGHYHYSSSGKKVYEKKK